MSTRIRGTALAPGVSKNNRYYSPEMIRQAVERAQPRVQDGRMIMRSHHQAGDNTALVCGRVTSLTVGENGEARFTAELAGTSTARDIAKLVRGPRPFVDGVSIAGCWVGAPRKVTVGGERAETASGVDIHSIDFTHNPGVDAARIVAETLAAARYPIFESAPEPVTAEEPSALELASMPLDEFQNYAAGAMTRTWGSLNSPFYRGMGV